jgi:HAD superfamily hydrolase (TIGR01509 family)
MSITERLPAFSAADFPSAVLFDLDGLLIDSERLDMQLSQALATELGFKLEAGVLRTLVGIRTVDVDPDVLKPLGCSMDFQSFAALVKRRTRNWAAIHGIPVKPGVAELLDHLDAIGMPRAIATGAIRSEALANLGTLVDRFNAAAFGDEVRAGKPSPDSYLLAAARLGVDPVRCLALEDSDAGVRAAERAGCTAIMVPDLVPASPDTRYVCHSLLRVRDWLTLGS